MSAARLVMAAFAGVMVLLVASQFVEENSARLMAVLAAIFELYSTRESKPLPILTQRLTTAHELHLARVGGKPAGISGIESVAEVKDFDITGSSPVDFLAIFSVRTTHTHTHTLTLTHSLTHTHTHTHTH